MSERSSPPPEPLISGGSRFTQDGFILHGGACPDFFDRNLLAQTCILGKIHGATHPARQFIHISILLNPLADWENHGEAVIKKHQMTEFR
jgi:hypothetical protein